MCKFCSANSVQVNSRGTTVTETLLSWANLARLELNRDEARPAASDTSAEFNTVEIFYNSVVNHIS